MSLGPLPDGSFRRARTDTLGYTTITLAGVAALSLLLWVAAISQVALATSQAGRPGFEAQVVACPQPGGNAGRCDVRLTRDGHQLEALLVRPGFFAPDVGDHLTVTVVSEATPERPAEVTPAGARLALTTLTLLALAVTFTIWAGQRSRRFWRLLIRTVPRRPGGPPDEGAGPLHRAVAVRAGAVLGHHASPPPALSIRMSKVPRG